MNALKRLDDYSECYFVMVRIKQNYELFYDEHLVLGFFHCGVTCYLGEVNIVCFHLINKYCPMLDFFSSLSTCSGKIIVLLMKYFPIWDNFYKGDFTELKSDLMKTF